MRPAVDVALIVMKACVIRPFHEPKILKRVVRRIAVDVMDAFVALKSASDRELHDADVLEERVGFARPRVSGVRDVRHDVTVGMNRPSTSPLRVIRTATSSPRLLPSRDAPLFQVVLDSGERRPELSSHCSDRGAGLVREHDRVDRVGRKSAKAAPLPPGSLIRHTTAAKVVVEGPASHAETALDLDGASPLFVGGDGSVDDRLRVSHTSILAEA